MSFKALVESKTKTPHIVFHAFRVSKADKDVIHVFLESTDDMAFYGPHLRHRGIQYLVHDCDNKSNVLLVAELVRNRSKRLEECVFIVDKDLSDYLGQPSASVPKERLFVTAPYSVDSYVCCDAGLDILFLELSGVTSRAKYMKLRSKYLKSQQALWAALHLISAIILVARRAGEKVNLNNFSFSRIVRVQDDRLVLRARYWRVFLNEVNSGFKYDYGVVRSALKEMREADRGRWARGKYLLDLYYLFFRCLAEKVKVECGTKGHLGKKIKVIDVQNARGMFFALSSRITSQDFYDFLDATVIAHRGRA